MPDPELAVTAPAAELEGGTWAFSAGTSGERAGAAVGSADAAGKAVTWRPVLYKRKSAMESSATIADPTNNIERCRLIARTLFAFGTSGSVGSARLPERGRDLAAVG